LEVMIGVVFGKTAAAQPTARATHSRSVPLVVVYLTS